MYKNNRIIRLDKDTIGLILDPEDMLVIKDEHFVTMGPVPEDNYPIHPVDLIHLPWETKVIIHAVLVSHGLALQSPYRDEMTSNTR